MPGQTTEPAAPKPAAIGTKLSLPEPAVLPTGRYYTAVTYATVSKKRLQMELAVVRFERFARFDTRRVEQVVDKAAQSIALGDNDSEELALVVLRVDILVDAFEKR